MNGIKNRMGRSTSSYFSRIVRYVHTSNAVFACMEWLKRHLDERDVRLDLCAVFADLS